MDSLLDHPPVNDNTLQLALPLNSISTLYNVTARQQEDICTVSSKSNQVWSLVPVRVAGIQNGCNDAVGAVCVPVLRCLMYVM